MRINSRPIIKGAAGCGVLVMALSACPSNPVPDEKIAVAKAEVQRAEGSGAPEFAPVQMAATRDKLAGTEKASTDHHLPSAALAGWTGIYRLLSSTSGIIPLKVSRAPRGACGSHAATELALALRARQPAVTATFIAIDPLEQLPVRPGGAAKLPGKLIKSPSRAVQLYHLAPELRCVSLESLGHLESLAL
jgi:hypothetical protein